MRTLAETVVKTKCVQNQSNLLIWNLHCAFF